MTAQPLTETEQRIIDRVLALVRTREPGLTLYAADGTHKYSSTHFEMVSPIRELALGIAMRITDEELAADGREDDIHVTIKYGLHTANAADVARVVRGFGSITVSFGAVSLFQKDDCDVVKVEVISPDLHRLNALIGKSLPHTDTHPDYTPHMTLAYVKPGEGRKYEGMDPFEGESATFDRFIFSDPDGRKSVILLAGDAEPMPVVVAYAADADDGDGRWVTIGAQQGEDGEKHGGTPVFIQGGKIVKGPRALQGRTVAQLKGQKRQAHEAEAHEAAARHRETTQRLDAIHGVLDDRRNPTAMEAATGIDREPGVGKPSETERMGIHQPAESSGTPPAKSLPREEQARQRFNEEQVFNQPHKRRTFDQAVNDLRGAGGSDKDVQDLINLYAPEPKAAGTPPAPNPADGLPPDVAAFLAKNPHLKVVPASEAPKAGGKKWSESGQGANAMAKAMAKAAPPGGPGYDASKAEPAVNAGKGQPAATENSPTKGLTTPHAGSKVGATPATETGGKPGGEGGKVEATNGLPRLQGSEKQATWAEQIRRDYLSGNRHPHIEHAGRLIRQIAGDTLNDDDAKFWIDNKGTLDSIALSRKFDLSPEKAKGLELKIGGNLSGRAMDKSRGKPERQFKLDEDDVAVMKLDPAKAEMIVNAVNEAAAAMSGGGKP